METNPEEKINQERRYVLRRIREAFLRTKKASPVHYTVHHNFIGGDGPTADNEVRTLEKLEELGAIKIIDRHENANGWEVFQLEVIEPPFGELYTKYEKSFVPLERSKKQTRVPPATVRITESNFHFGTGDNVGRDKIKKQDNFMKDIPLWLKYLVAVATVIGVGWTVYIYFIPGGGFVLGSPITHSEAENETATSTLNISDILAKYNALDTNLEQRNFLEKYRDAKIYGRGIYKNIDKPGDRFLITVNVSTGLVSCYTNGDLETEQKLSLLKIGQTVNFTGTFSTSVTWGGGWSVDDCIVAK